MQTILPTSFFRRLIDQFSNKCATSGPFEYAINLLCFFFGSEILQSDLKDFPLHTKAKLYTGNITEIKPKSSSGGRRKRRIDLESGEEIQRGFRPGQGSHQGSDRGHIAAGLKRSDGRLKKSGFLRRKYIIPSSRNTGLTLFTSLSSSHRIIY